MARCNEDKIAALEILSLEKDRLQAASEKCQNVKLSDCQAHNDIEEKIHQRYVALLNTIKLLLAGL